MKLAADVLIECRRFRFIVVYRALHCSVVFNDQLGNIMTYPCVTPNVVVGDLNFSEVDWRCENRV